MSFFSKLFGKNNNNNKRDNTQSTFVISKQQLPENQQRLSTYPNDEPTQKNSGFEIIDIEFDIPMGSKVEFGQKITATITYDSVTDVQIWLMPDTGGEMSGQYEPSELEPAGRHTISRYIAINDVNNGVEPKLSQAYIEVKDDNGQIIYGVVFDVDYQFIESSDPEYHQR
ncbi:MULTISPECIES: hypothetical protein [unclassified Acinetobacter]|uniref:hypothetical protein n=1 Tax=unclassified Acinetobacter TaxID=196816 RepID=UPI0035B7AB5F